MPIYCQHLPSSDSTEFLHGPSLIKGFSWIMSVRGRKLNGVDGEIVSCKDVAYSGKGDWHSALWCRFYFGVFVCLPVPTKVRKHSSVAESLLPSLFALHDRPLRCIAWSPAPWIGWECEFWCWHRAAAAPHLWTWKVMCLLCNLFA